MIPSKFIKSSLTSLFLLQDKLKHQISLKSVHNQFTSHHWYAHIFSLLSASYFQHNSQSDLIKIQLTCHWSQIPLWLPITPRIKAEQHPVVHLILLVPASHLAPSFSSFSQLILLQPNWPPYLFHRAIKTLLSFAWFKIIHLMSRNL